MPLVNGWHQSNVVNALLIIQQAMAQTIAVMSSDVAGTHKYIIKLKVNLQKKNLKIYNTETKLTFGIVSFG